MKLLKQRKLKTVKNGVIKDLITAIQPRQIADIEHVNSWNRQETAPASP